MIVEDHTSKGKNKRLGSNYTVDLGEDRFFSALRSFWTCLNFFNPFGPTFVPTFVPSVRLGLAVMVDLILEDGNGKNNLERSVRETQLWEMKRTNLSSS